MAQDKGQALGWDDEGKVQDNSFEVLPEGEYDYEVVNLRHERFEGSDKMSARPVAALQLRCTNRQTGVVGTGFCRLYLNSKVLWRITAFFKSCGLLDPATPEGTTFSMGLFDQAVGCAGTVKVKVTQSQRNGKTYENNEFDFVAAQPAAAPAQPAWGGKGF